jgi:protein-S-isoprenylcysteine O-methyltransferase Ste14
MHQSARPARGGGWVAAQMVLFVLIFVAPLIERSVPPTLLAVPLGLFVGLIGLIFGLRGIMQLGSSLSIFPRPVPNGQLVRTGVYRFVRHPIYTGVILCALGWAIVTWSGLAFIGAFVLGVFFDRKSAQEEIWLSEQYPDYADYQRQTKKLIPGLY